MIEPLIARLGGVERVEEPVGRGTVDRRMEQRQSRADPPVKKVAPQP
jgi:hypothetical protein